MKITFDEEAGQLVDIFDSLEMICNTELYEEVLKKFQVSQEEIVEKALEDLKKNIKLDKEKLNFLFNDESKIFNSLINYKKLLMNTTLSDLFKSLKELNEEEIKINLIKKLSDYKLENQEELKAMVSSNSNILEFIRGLDISSGVKWNLFDFIEHTKDYVDEFIKLIEAYVPQYNKIMSKYKKHREKKISYYKTKINNEGINYIKTLGGDIYNYEANYEEIYVSIMFFNSYSLVWDDTEDSIYLLLGINVENTFKKIYGDTELENNLLVYKNLCDKTRYSIIRLLSVRDYYGLELAEKLGITTATVSYHMSFLLLAKMVSIEKRDHKAYYTLNKEPLKNSMDFLKKDLNI